MQNQKGFIGLQVLIAILVGLVVLGGGAYYVVQQNTPSQTPSDNLQQLPTQVEQPLSKDSQLPPSTSSSKSSVEIVSMTYPSLTYRINDIEHRDAWIRIIDVPSGLAMWDETEIKIGTHEINLASLVRYEDVKISLPAGTYRLRLEVFIGGIGKTLAESGTFTVPGSVVAVPTCTIGMTSPAGNAVTLTWTSKNADEAYIAHSLGKGGSAVIYGLNNGKEVSLNGSEMVNIVANHYYWLVVKNTRGATACFQDGTSHFNSQKEIENPPTMG
ncbi:MAG: hypothetical protein Q7S26_04240 [bacterium]|nr:hypothetical protein [bacterium]